MNPFDFPRILPRGGAVDPAYARKGIRNRVVNLMFGAVAAGIVSAVATAGAQDESRHPAATTIMLTTASPTAAQEKPQEVTAPIGKQEVSAASAERVNLDELLREALDKNPAIKSAARRVLALRARVPQARSLPDPLVATNWMGNIIPYSVQQGDPSSYRGLTAMQEIPFPGKLRLRGQVADREAEAAWWEYEKTRRQVVADVKSAYYQYFYYRKALDITQKNKDLLEKLAKIAEVQFKVGKGLQQDVLKAQVEVSRLLQRLTVFEQQERTARVQLNTLLFREPEASLPPPAPFEQARFTQTLESLYELGRQNDTELQRAERMIERGQYAVNLARKEYNPDFRVEYMYQQRPLMPDMHGVRFGINIPIFYQTKQREGVIEASEDLISARRSHDFRQTTVFFEVKENYLAAKAADDLARLYSRAIVPQSTLALESSLAAYQVGKLDFLSMVTNFTTVLDYELGYYEELSNFQKALARLEVTTGVELTK